MKRKYWLFISSAIMVMIGFLRGIGGIALFSKGNQLVTDNTIIATNLQIKIVAFGLLLICILFIYASINLLRKNSTKSWNLCWVVLSLFLIGGLFNGFLLFGKPLEQGQTINFIAVFIVGVFMFLGKPALKDYK